MAFRLGLTGPPNSGKTYSWRDFGHGEKVFAICPSNKMIHLKQSNGEFIEDEIEITSPSKGLDTTEKMFVKFGVNNKPALMSKIYDMVNKKQLPLTDLEITGNFVYCSDMTHVANCKRFVAKCMPNIRIILTTDFTHFVSNILTTKKFRSRKKGGEAFERFWDLAADALINILLVSDELPNNLIDITEFHSGDYDESTGTLNIYVPAGNMLKNSFMPKSYFDIMLFSKVLPHKHGQPQKDRYKFVVIPVDHFDGRSMGLFDNDMDADGQVPNSMNLILPKVIKHISHRQ